MAVYEDSDSRDSIGSIPFHHKELAEHLRSDLHAKQHGEPCRRAGEQTLFTNRCHETMGKEAWGGLLVMMVATRVVDNYHMRWTGICAPALNIALLSWSNTRQHIIHQLHHLGDSVHYSCTGGEQGRWEDDRTRLKLCSAACIVAPGGVGAPFEASRRPILLVSGR